MVLRLSAGYCIFDFVDRGDRGAEVDGGVFGKETASFRLKGKEIMN